MLDGTEAGPVFWEEWIQERPAEEGNGGGGRQVSFYCEQLKFNPTGGIMGVVQICYKAVPLKGQRTWVFNHDSYPQLTEDCPGGGALTPSICLSPKWLSPPAA